MELLAISEESFTCWNMQYTHSSDGQKQALEQASNSNILVWVQQSCQSQPKHL